MTQEQALKIMKTGVNIYLTGSAGAGKTYLLNKYISYLQEHDISVAVTASTGIAATHMNGMTIHSWSGIGIKNRMDERDLSDLEDKKYLWKRFEKARVLIIDEVSMLHGYQLDMIEKVCRRFKRSNDPFGGLQVILSGDFFQLPPVEKTGQGVSMVYESDAWQILNPAICYISEQHRQEDEILINILNTIRSNSIEELQYEQLEKRINAELKNVKPTKLYTHNINVDNENNIELGKIDEETKVYQMTSTGKDNLIEILKKSCIAYENLYLKIGAEVMSIKNNFDKGYVNGSRGKVIHFDTETGNPVVMFYNGVTQTVSPELWAIEEDGKIKASITQIPLRLAWAITIHKSQGMSLDHAEIDLRTTFTYGMGYVALSRVRSISGIKLLGINRESLKVNPKVLEFDQDLKNESYNNEIMFKKLSKEDQNKMEINFIERMGGSVIPEKKKKSTLSKTHQQNSRTIDTKVPTVLITKELLDQGKNIKEITKERGLTAGTITHHIEQIMSAYPDTKISHIRPPKKHIDLVEKANKKLKGEEIGKLNPIKIMLEEEGHNLSFEEIRLAKLFI